MARTAWLCSTRPHTGRYICKWLHSWAGKVVQAGAESPFSLTWPLVPGLLKIGTWCGEETSQSENSEG